MCERERKKEERERERKAPGGGGGGGGGGGKTERRRGRASLCENIDTDRYRHGFVQQWAHVVSKGNGMYQKSIHQMYLSNDSRSNHIAQAPIGWSIT